MKCKCGKEFEGNFCPNCGRPAIETNDENKEKLSSCEQIKKDKKNVEDNIVNKEDKTDKFMDKFTVIRTKGISICCGLAAIFMFYKGEIIPAILLLICGECIGGWIKLPIKKRTSTCLGVLGLILAIIISAFTGEKIENKNACIEAVKNSTTTEYPDVTFGEAFNNYFVNPKWELKENDEDKYIVTFTGDCTYNNSPISVRTDFTVYKSSDEVELSYLSYNDVAQTELSQMELTYTVFEDYLKKHKNVEAETDNIEETENAEENAKENTESYLQTDIQEIERNPEQYAGEKIHLEAKFTVLLGNLEIWANNGYVDVEYNGTAYDVNGNEIGSVVAGDEGYVEGSVEIYDNELGNKDFRINADRVVITSDVGNDTYSQSENEKTNNTEDSSATTPEYTIYGYYMAQNGDEIYLNDSSEVSDNGTDFVAEMSVLSGSQYQWSGYIVDISANPIQVLSKSEKAVALITPAEDGIFVEFCNSSNSQKVWYNKETENEVIDQNADSFIGAMGQYISTSGGTENYVNMEIYDSGNDSINITFKSMTHGGVVSAQGKIIGSDTVEADWNNVHFTLEWTDAGNVLVTREGSTGYSDFDKFTEYETFINNFYYQEG